MDNDKIKVPAERIEQSILLIRSQKVMLDNDLAVLYGVPTKVLNQAVRRNLRRFPPDFMFRLTKKEKLELVTKCDRFQKLKYFSSLPCACTERSRGVLFSRATGHGSTGSPQANHDYADR